MHERVRHTYQPAHACPSMHCMRNRTYTTHQPALIWPASLPVRRCVLSVLLLTLFRVLLPHLRTCIPHTHTEGCFIHSFAQSNPHRCCLPPSTHAVTCVCVRALLIHVRIRMCAVAMLARFVISSSSTWFVGLLFVSVVVSHARATHHNTRTRSR